MSLHDELNAARSRAWERLSEMREIWMPLVPSNVGFPGWRDDPQEPVLRELVVEFEQQAPDVWAQAEVQLLADAAYARAREGVREVQELIDRAHGFDLAARGDGEVPPDLQLLYLGKAAPGPYLELLPGLTSVSVVTDEFTTALQRAGLTGGWSTVDVPVVDRTGAALIDHRLLVITGRVTEKPEKFGTTMICPSDTAQHFALARRIGRPDGAGTTAYASDVAKEALRAVPLPGVRLDRSTKPMFLLAA
ncbi:hypothetical protein ACVU7I_00900 [Patulibacter sp. S7RM1-6]